MTGYNTVFAEGSSNRCLPIENIKLIQLYFIGFNGELFEVSLSVLSCFICVISMYFVVL